MANIDIHIINGQYFNYAGKNPDVPLSVSYGKRLYSIQERYGNIPIKEGRGHGKLEQKKESYVKLKDSENIRVRKDNVINLYQINHEDFTKLGLNPLDLRTRFRSGFKVYQDEFKYDSITYHNARDGVIPLEYYLNKLPNDVFGRDDVYGGFRYVIYDRKTRKVHLNYEYGEQT